MAVRWHPMNQKLPNSKLNKAGSLDAGSNFGREGRIPVFIRIRGHVDGGHQGPQSEYILDGLVSRIPVFNQLSLRDDIKGVGHVH